MHQHKIPTNHFVSTNGIDIHFIAYRNDNPTLILMHGLTANAHAFGGLVEAGLTEHFQFISPDLRGRGLSSKPARGYSFDTHAKDILGLMDYIGVEKAYLGGHSFGGLLTAYMSAKYPDRVAKTVILDAASKLNPKAPEMLAPALSRLDKKFESRDAYMEYVKKAPYNTFWELCMESYYQADIKENEDGTVEPRSNLTNIIECSLNVAHEPWDVWFSRVQQEAILVNALDIYTMNEPLLPDMYAKDCVERMFNAAYHAVDGNHQTMLYGEGARQTVSIIKKFLLG